jgi:hypothetical protein
MEHLEKGKYYRFDSEIYYVEEIFPDKKWGNRYRVKNIARYESQRLFIYKNVNTHGLADGLDGVTKATEDIKWFLMMIFTSDYRVIYVDK